VTRRRTAARRVVGLLLVVGVTACGNQASATRAGDVVLGHIADEVTGDSAYVLLPTGRIDFTVGGPVEKVSADQAGDGEEHPAPDGGRFVPVTWKHDPFGAGAVPVEVMGAQPKPAEVTLVAGGTEASLGSPYRVVGGKGTTDTGIGTIYVAVDSVADLRIDVTYDGLTQSVHPSTGEHEAGAAAPLYDEPTVGIEALCTSEGFASGRLRPDISCLVNPPQRSPYLPGHGWAEAGHAWLLVSVDISISGVEVRGSSYDVDSIDPRLTVNGSDPLPSDERYGSAEPLPAAVRGVWAFDGSADDANSLGIALDCILEKSAGPGPSTREVTLHQTIDLG